MKRVAISLAAIGLLGLAANQALAQRVVSPVVGTHVTAGHGIQRASHVGTLHYYRQVGRSRPGYYGRHRYGGYHGGYAPVIVPRRYVPRYLPRYLPHRPPVGVPYHRYARPYGHPYYGPYRGFSYSGPGISIGIGF